jgi:uncharacterized membrane protein YkoI
MRLIAAFTSFICIAILAGAANAQAEKIGMAKATQIATKRVHGTIKSKELEKEKGKWIYSFDIRTGKGGITEVAVDAYSGRVISVEHETAANEAKEAKEEKREKH